MDTCICGGCLTLDAADVFPGVIVFQPCRCVFTWLRGRVCDSEMIIVCLCLCGVVSK